MLETDAGDLSLPPTRCQQRRARLVNELGEVSDTNLQDFVLQLFLTRIAFFFFLHFVLKATFLIILHHNALFRIHRFHNFKFRNIRPRLYMAVDVIFLSFSTTKYWERYRV